MCIPIIGFTEDFDAQDVEVHEHLADVPTHDEVDLVEANDIIESAHGLIAELLEDFELRGLGPFANEVELGYQFRLMLERMSNYMVGRS